MRPHALSALLLASLPLAACSPAPAPPTMPGGNAAGPLPAAAPPPATGRTATPAAPADAAPAADGASIAGADGPDTGTAALLVWNSTCALAAASASV